MAEFALAAPVLILLLFGMTLAGFYAFRAAAADWGIFITGAAEGSYASPATDQIRSSIAWGDIRGAIATGGSYGNRQVSSQIAITNAHPWVYGINLIEAHEASAYFRLWRFYAGPPEPGGVE